MSGFADFLLASKKDARAIARMNNPTSKLPGFDTGNVNEIDLQNLYEILTGKDALLEFETLYCDSSGYGPLVSCVPAQLVDALAGLTPEAGPQVAEKWSKTEEFRDLWEVTDLESILGKLVEFAKRARNEKKDLLLSSSGA